MKLIFIVISVCVCANSADVELGTIVFANAIYRHGDRSPVLAYPKDPYADEYEEIWPYGSGELTPIGMEQHFQLGSYLRRRYQDLLPETYNVNDLHVSSSSTDRCLMSAECNLNGLYQSKENQTENIHFQPIPIHTTPETEDKILSSETLCHKYIYSEINVKQSDPYKCIANLTKDVRSEIRKKSGLFIEESYVHDVLFIEDAYNLTLPNWTSDYYPEPLATLYLYDSFLIPYSTKELQRYSSGPLFGQMVNNMVRKSENKLSPDRKLFVYSAHDSTVSKLLLGLGVHNGKLVPYAACVLVELRLKSEEYYVTVSYKNDTGEDPYLLQIPGCDQMCPLDTFVDLTQDVIPNDLQAECQEDPEDEIVFRLPLFAFPEDWQQCFASDTMCAT